MKYGFSVLTVCLFLLVMPWFTGQGQGNSVAAFQPVESALPVLILDAGHGGEDGGASSAAGDKESDVNLAIVLRMEQILALCGKPAVLTRREDVSIHDKGAQTIREKKVSDIKNRVKLVNETENCLLLSVHQNSFTDSRYAGSQVFYGKAEGSQLWGEWAQELLRISLDRNNHRTAKPIQEDVYLMDHVSCPAILVECGFMSNGAEASLLLTSSYQKKVAAALSGGYLQYIQTMQEV